MKRLELPRDEMAFRKEYADSVLAESLTTVFRPGNRVFPNWRGYKRGEFITARIIERVGDDSKMLPPVFRDEKKLIMIKNIQVFNLDELSERDFEGSSYDVKSIDGLKKHLLWIYKKNPSDYDNLVTKIDLQYVDEQNFCSIQKEPVEA